MLMAFEIGLHWKNWIVYFYILMAMLHVLLLLMDEGQ